MSRTEIVDTFVIGQGPKGIATAHRLTKKHTMDVLSIDIHGPGASWREGVMNRKLPITSRDPRGWEIMDDPNVRFESFWAEKKNNNHLRVRNTSIRGATTAAHFRHYLKWLARDLPSLKGNVTNLDFDPQRKIYEVEIFDRDKHRRIEARSVVIASGLIGYGGSEFTYDPTGLRGKSDKVMHMPTDLRTEQPTLDFLKGAKDIAVIGGGNSAASLFWIVLKAPWVEKVRLITSMDLRFESANNLNIPPFNYERLVEEQRGIHYPNVKVLGAMEQKDKMVLHTDNGKLAVDRVVVTTGYRYDFTQLPFTQTLIKKNLFEIGHDERYPKINEDHQIVGKEGPTLVYIIGEGAAAKGSDQRVLASTIESTKTIANSLVQKFS